MDYKHCCVINAGQAYKTLVLVLLKPDESGQIRENIQYYALMEGEALVDTVPPTLRLDAGAAGFIAPKWDEETAAWVEGATAEEITAWEEAHPAPEEPKPEENELTMTQMAVAELAQVVEENNTANQMAIAELAESILGGE